MLISENKQIFNNPIDALASAFNNSQEFLQFIVEHRYIKTETKHAGCAFVVSVCLDDENMELIKEECYNRNIWTKQELIDMDEDMSEYLEEISKPRYTLSPN